MLRHLGTFLSVLVLVSTWPTPLAAEEVTQSDFAVKSTCEAAVKEVTTLEEIRKLNYYEQKVAFSQLEAREQSAMMREHLQHTANSLSLSETQKGFLLRVAQMMTVEVYANPEMFRASSEFREIQGSIRTLFSYELAQVIFESFGVGRGNLMALALPGPKCSCSTSDDWCDGDVWEPDAPRLGKKCKAVECIPRSAGCGSLFLSSCNGECVKY